MSRRFENFGVRLAAASDAQPPADDPEMPEGQPTKPDDDEDPDHNQEEAMTEITEAALVAAREEGRTAGVAEGQKAERDRMTAVFASTNCAGREAHAVRLLGRSMSAEEITDELAHLPKTEGPNALTEEQQREAQEQGGREEMRSELDKNKNSSIDAGGAEGGGGQPKSKASQILADHRAFTGKKPKANA